jgi:adenine-specific DNA-methyltransferase
MHHPELKGERLMAKASQRKVKSSERGTTQQYVHQEEAVARPEIGAAPRFREKASPTTYRYDSSLGPALDWDTNPARETAAFLLRCIEETAGLPAPHEFREPRELTGADGAALLRIGGLQDAVAALKRMQTPFLDWAGKAERQSLEVPTLPLFVHERLSTAAIIKTLEDHRKRPDQGEMLDLFADPRMPLSQQVNAYHYKNGWVNRLILGDSLVVMNSLLRFEGLGGQVQMIYIDPPYGVKFGSNFQPFVRKPEAPSGYDDKDFTREPEMVQAYRDTWQLGLHSYLTYLRDRLLLARDLMAETGSIFVQISDENIHHVREIMDDIFGAENFVSQISFQTTSGFETKTIAALGDFLLWYARDKDRLFVSKLYQSQGAVLGEGNARWVLLPDGAYRGVTAAEKRGEVRLPDSARLYTPGDLQSQGASREPQPFKYGTRTWLPNPGAHWKANYPVGMQRLADAGRIHTARNSIRYRRFHLDFPFEEIGNIWTDTITGSFTDEKLYVVQTNRKVIERCILLSTRPGELVLDPTCGSGSTAYMAERWGRRWITIDTSRVPLALARQLLLSTTYPWFELMDATSGPAGGFRYQRRQNEQGEQTGGIVLQIKLETIANNEQPTQRVLVDRPEKDDKITRISGPFVVEATLPTPQQLTDESAYTPPQDEPSDHIMRMIEVLRRSPTIALPGNRKVTLKSIRRPGRSLSLSAEAQVDLDASGNTVSLVAAIDAAHEKNTGGLEFSARSVAILFGPADGPVTTKAVLDAAKEANVKAYSHLYVIGFTITAEARAEIDAGEDVLGLPATFVAATMDLQMGDLLKTQRSSQIFSVCGAPDVEVVRLDEAADDGTPRWQVTLRGLDVFDPVTMQSHHAAGHDVPCWMLDTAYNGMVFHADQVFFPKTSAWESLRKALRATHDEAVWEHLAGATSAPFAAATGSDIAVKVIDERGNELPVIRRLS